MSFPASLTVRTVKGRFVTHPDGVPAKGFVRIVLDSFMQGPTDDTFVAVFDRTFRLINGEFSTMLPATNDPQWSGSFYRVYITTETKLPEDCYRDPRNEANTTTIKARLEVPYDSNVPIDLADVLNVPAASPGSIYIVSSLRGVPGGIATLGDDGKVVSSQLPGSSGGAVEWTDVLDKPSSFPPSTHTHAESDVTGLTADLATKADASTVTTALAAKADASAVTTALAGKANTSHTHAQTDITGLASALSGKADASATTTALATKADASTVTSALSFKADLVGGVVPTSQIPSISKIDFLGSVSNQTAMLALTGQSGDWCIRTDLGQTWVITGADSTQLASWTSMPLGTAPVQTVNGQIGTVVLGKTDVGLGNVDNTSDLSKPVSTAQQTALNLKANLNSPTFTGTVSGVTAAMVGLGNVTNTSDANKPVSTAQQTAIDLKADKASPTFTGTPAAPTPTTGDSTTKIATTAFVGTAVAAYGLRSILLGPDNGSNPVPGGTPANTLVFRTT
jgi:hypothetical protein